MKHESDGGMLMPKISDLLEGIGDEVVRKEVEESFRCSRSINRRGLFGFLAAPFVARLLPTPEPEPEILFGDFNHAWIALIAKNG